MTTTALIQEKTLFALGKTVATPGALQALQDVNCSPLTLLSRHQRGDWGKLDAEDQVVNTAALKNNGRIFSSYPLSEETKVWLITEADRSATTLLLPEEY